MGNAPTVCTKECNSPSDEKDVSKLSGVTPLGLRQQDLDKRLDACDWEPAPADTIGPLTADDISLVRTTWTMAKEFGTRQVGVIVIRYFFELAPDAKQLFPFKNEVDMYESDSLRAHVGKFMEFISLVVNGLGDIVSIAKIVNSLGLRHVGYGARRPHFDAMGQALLKSLKVFLGGAYDPTARSAWAKVVEFIRKNMLEGNPALDGVVPPANGKPALGVVLSDDDKALVENSWGKVAALGTEAVGIILFRNVFEMAPAALALFVFKDVQNLYESRQLKKVAAKVIDTIGRVVAGLRDQNALTPVLHELGKRHAGYGVVSEHYDVVGIALMKTLRVGLGDEFTPALKTAWAKVYDLMAKIMIGNNYATT